MRQRIIIIFISILLFQGITEMSFAIGEDRVKKNSVDKGFISKKVLDTAAYKLWKRVE